MQEEEKRRTQTQREHAAETEAQGRDLSQDKERQGLGAATCSQETLTGQALARTLREEPPPLTPGLRASVFQSCDSTRFCWWKLPSLW